MQTLHKHFILFLFILLSSTLYAQDKPAAKALVEQGIALNDSGKYAEAIAKYNEALKKDTANLQALYEMSYTLYASGKPKEAIPYLEKVAPTNTYPEAYDLVASIYDDQGDYVKSMSYYKLGITAFPDYQRLRFNLGISYLRQKMYPEAEEAAIKAIQLNPKHASSHRLYALATYGQDKRGMSLLAWCSFLMLEPQTKRSLEGYRYVDKIINYGIKRTSEKSTTISISPKDSDVPELLMPLAVLGATSDKTGLSRADSLALQLKSLFEISEEFAGKKKDPFYKSFFSDYFKNLAASPNMPAFTRLISVYTYPDDNLKWFKENDEKLKELQSWFAATKREP
jgi:tetratricopeptide (TPR) repeat protein